MSNDLKTKGSHYKMKKITAALAAFAFICVVLFAQCKNANVKHEGFPSGKSDNYDLRDNTKDDSASSISGTITPARKVISDQMIPDNYKPGDSSAVMHTLPLKSSSNKSDDENNKKNKKQTKNNN